MHHMISEKNSKSSFHPFRFLNYIISETGFQSLHEDFHALHGEENMVS